MNKFAFLLLLLAGCAAQSPWRSDSLSAGDPHFDSSRLTYSPLSGYPPWKIEFLKIEEEIIVSLYLTQHRLHPTESTKILVTLRIEEERMEESVPLYEGNMKLRFSSSLAQKLIQSLQEGKKVSILIDGFEETIDPDLFEKNFTKLNKSRLEWLDIRNPLQ